MRDCLTIPEMQEFLREAEDLGISLSEGQARQFYAYYEMLTEKNKVMNLTGITELPQVLKKHFIDSLTLVKAVDPKEAGRILDLGTGAGFPGIPLKIAFPQAEITLLDSLKKRLLFLDEVIHALGLSGISTLHGRAEDYAKQGAYRESYDLCVSRAVANLSTLSEYCLPYVKVGGFFVSYKAQAAGEELERGRRAVQILGGETEELISFPLPHTDMERTLIRIRKTARTPRQYPRKAGLPGKEPLG